MAADVLPRVADRLVRFPASHDFALLADPGYFAPVPDGWLLGLTDVVASTAAVAAGRYKAVNMAGAAAISAMMNALGSPRFPFAFTGDGSLFAVPPDDGTIASEVLSQTAAWVRDDLGLTLRAALIPVAALREAGADIKIALYAPTSHVAYAMFEGGVARADAWTKAGHFAVPAGGTGERPDLTGLSCRWLPIRAREGAILSLIVRPGSGTGFHDAVKDLLALISARGHPVPKEGPPPALFSPGLALETAASRGAAPFWRRWPQVFLHTVMGYGFFVLNAKAGGFDARRYRRLAGENADVRKIADGLLVTLDASPSLEAALRARLTTAAEDGAVRYGLFRQDAALMTCIVPSYQADGHFHFIDGARGGYTAAAVDLDARHGRRKAAG